jgi:hypothetical protein
MLTLLGTALTLLVLAWRFDLNWLEWPALIVVLLLVRFRPSLWARQFRCIEGLCARMARRQALSVAAIGLSTVALRLALLPAMPVPQPRIVDEFSHSLLADTLLKGRLTNPTHPLWRQFETIQEIQRPTYNSMYFPAQGIFLAAGRVLGHPWFGVLMSVGLMSAAVLWMLQGWFPPGWALLGSVICSLRYGLFSYWMNSYWGGAVGVIGGALVLGAIPRIRRGMLSRHFVLLAAGLLLLANSRPFEGAALSIAPGLSLLGHIRRQRGPALRRALSRPIPAFLLVMATGCVLMATYFRAVTGNPLTPPYRVNQQTYGWPLTLPWFSVKPVAHRWQPMHDYFLWEVEQHRKFQLGTHVLENGTDLVVLWSFFAGPLLSVPLLFLPGVWRDRRLRLLFFTAACMVVALCLEQSRYPHYASPGSCVYIALLVASMRVMRASGRRSGKGPAMVRLLSVASLACTGALLALPAHMRAPDRFNPYTSWCCSVGGNLERAAVLERLRSANGRHLVIVRYAPGHNWMNEWVWNDADIDQSKVVWARDDGRGNQALVGYFKDRTVWLLEPDRNPARLNRLSEKAP